MCVCVCVCARVCFRFTTASIYIPYHHGRNQANVTETERRTIISYTNRPHTSIHRHEKARARARAHTHTHTHTQTFAALRSVIDITSWAIVTFHGSRRVDAFAFAVAATVVFCALVDV